MKDNARWDGCVHVEYKGVEYDVDIHATGYEYHDPGCMYLRNGDPGYPPEDDCDINLLEIEAVFIDNEEITLTEELERALEICCEEAILEGQLETEWLDAEPWEDEE